MNKMLSFMSKRLNLSIHYDGAVITTEGVVWDAPRDDMSKFDIEQFVESKLQKEMFNV